MPSKAPSGRLRQMKQGTIFCNMWCTCIPANGTLLLETSHAMVCQCWKASSELALLWVEHHQALPWCISTSQNTLKEALVVKLLPTHVAMKLNIVRHSGRKLVSNYFSLPRGKGKSSSPLPHKILGTGLFLEILKDFKYGNVSKGSSAKSKSKDEKKTPKHFLLVDEEKCRHSFHWNADLGFLNCREDVF